MTPLYSVAETISRCLPQEWAYCSPTTKDAICVEIGGPRFSAIVFHYLADGERIQISGRWPKAQGSPTQPRDWGVPKHRPEPLLLLDKRDTAENMAKVIETQFLPAYSSIYLECLGLKLRGLRPFSGLQAGTKGFVEFTDNDKCRLVFDGLDLKSASDILVKLR